jgi:outer membrane lipoprotein SlyB
MTDSVLTQAQIAERSHAARVRWRKYRNAAAATLAGAAVGAAVGHKVGQRAGQEIALRNSQITPIAPHRLQKPVNRILGEMTFDRHAKVNWARNVREENIKRGFTKPIAEEPPSKPSYVGLYARLLRRRMGSAPAERAKLKALLDRNDTTWELSGDQERMLRRHLESLDAETSMLQANVDRLYAAKPKLRGDRSGAVVTRRTAEWTYARKAKKTGGADRSARMKAALAPGDDNKEMMRQFLETPEGAAAMKGKNKQAIERAFADWMKTQTSTKASPGTIGAKTKIVTARGRVDSQFKRRGGRVTLRPSSIGTTETNNMRTELRNEANDIAQRAHDYVDRTAHRDLPAATARLLDRVARVRSARIANVVIPRGRRLGGIAGAAIGAIGAGGAAGLASYLASRSNRTANKLTEITDLAKASKKNQRKRRKHPLTEIADGAEAAIARGIARSFAQMKDSVTTENVRDGGAGLLDQIQPTPAMTDPIAKAVARGVAAQSALDQPDGGNPKLLDFSLLARSPYVEQFSRRYAGDKITAITNGQREAIQQILNNGTLAGTPPAELAREIRDHIGLTPAQAQAVRNFRQKLKTDPRAAMTYALRDKRYDRTIKAAREKKEPLTNLQIETMTDAYQRRMLAYRATTIARTEAVGAANNGHMANIESWLIANPDFTVVKTWIATDDDRTRPDHVGLNRNVVIGLNTPFTAPSGEQLRWPHDPNGAAKEVVDCRCTVGTFLVRRRNALAMGPDAFAQPIPGFWQQPTREPFVADSPPV